MSLVILDALDASLTNLDDSGWDDDGALAPRPDDERFRGCSADRDYCASTWFEPRSEVRLVESRVARHPGRKDSKPPSGLVCSARLGAVEKLF